MSMGSASRFLHLDKLWVVTTHKTTHFEVIHCYGESKKMKGKGEKKEGEGKGKENKM